MDEITSKSNTEAAQVSPVQSDPSDIPQNKRHFKKYLLILIPVFVLVVVIGGYFLSTLLMNKSETVAPIKQNTSVERMLEIATHTYFKDGKPVQKIEEVNKKFNDGSLQTTVYSEGKQLSRQLFLRNKILSLRDKALTQQIFKTSSSERQYKTSGEYFLTYVKETPNLSKSETILNGRKTIIYIVGETEVNSLKIIPQAFAVDETSITKIYVTEESGELEKVEILDPSTGAVSQEIVYGTEAVEEVEQSGIDTMPQEDITPDLLAEEMEKEADTNNEIIVDSPAPLVPENDPITIFPLSIIPTSTGYNSAYMDVASNIFGVYEFSEKSLRETNVFENHKFVQEYVKVRIDGAEISYENYNISADTMWQNGERKDVIRFLVPPGLLPGYHTVEIFSIDTWYMAPSLMVTLPESGENVLELQLFSEKPPTTTALPDDQGYTISLSGENLIKPFKVVMTSTQGETFTIEDENVIVKDTRELILNLPPTFSPGIYSLTITKGNQTVYRPNYISVSK